MYHVEAITQCLLLQVPDTGVRDSIKGPIPEYPQQWFVIHSNDQVGTAKYEESCLVQCIGYCKGFTLNRRIPRIAGCVNRLPTRVTRQPSRQQNGLISTQLQCFWNSQNPTPVLDQSVVRHVGLVLSKMRTPCSISCTIWSLDSMKRESISSSQWKGVSGFRNRRNGAIRSVILKA